MARVPTLAPPTGPAGIRTALPQPLHSNALGNAASLLAGLRQENDANLLRKTLADYGDHLSKQLAQIDAAKSPVQLVADIEADSRGKVEDMARGLPPHLQEGFRSRAAVMGVPVRRQALLKSVELTISEGQAAVTNQLDMLGDQLSQAPRPDLMVGAVKDQARQELDGAAQLYTREQRDVLYRNFEAQVDSAVVGDLVQKGLATEALQFIDKNMTGATPPQHKALREQAMTMFRAQQGRRRRGELLDLQQMVAQMKIEPVKDVRLLDETAAQLQALEQAVRHDAAPGVNIIGQQAAFDINVGISHALNTISGMKAILVRAEQIRQGDAVYTASDQVDREAADQLWYQSRGQSAEQRRNVLTNQVRGIPQAAAEWGTRMVRSHNPNALFAAAMVLGAPLRSVAGTYARTDLTTIMPTEVQSALVDAWDQIRANQASGRDGFDPVALQKVIDTDLKVSQHVEDNPQTQTLARTIDAMDEPDLATMLGQQLQAFESSQDELPGGFLDVGIDVADRDARRELLDSVRRGRQRAEAAAAGSDDALAELRGVLQDYRRLYRGERLRLADVQPASRADELAAHTAFRRLLGKAQPSRFGVGPFSRDAVEFAVRDFRGSHDYVEPLLRTLLLDQLDKHPGSVGVQVGDRTIELGGEEPVITQGRTLVGSKGVLEAYGGELATIGRFSFLRPNIFERPGEAALGPAPAEHAQAGPLEDLALQIAQTFRGGLGQGEQAPLRLLRDPQGRTERVDFQVGTAGGLVPQHDEVPLYQILVRVRPPNLAHGVYAPLVDTETGEPLLVAPHPSRLPAWAKQQKEEQLAAERRAQEEKVNRTIRQTDTGVAFRTMSGLVFNIAAGARDIEAAADAAVRHKLEGIASSIVRGSQISDALARAQEREQVRQARGQKPNLLLGGRKVVP